MKVKITVHIYYATYSWQEAGEYQVMYAKLSDDEYRTYVGSQEIEIDVPDDYDPRAQKVAALEEKKKRAMADYQKTVTDINERISRLQALEYTA